MNDYQYWMELVELLMRSGWANKDLNYDIYLACKIFLETGDIEQLQIILETYPYLECDALRDLGDITNRIQEDPFFPPPGWNPGELERLEGQFIIGEVNSNGGTVGLDPEHFLKGLLTLGGSGSGKTVISKRLVSQIMQIPLSERDFNLIIIQALKNDMDSFIKPYPTLRVINEHSLRINPLQVEPWDDPKEKMESFVDIYNNSNWLFQHSGAIFEEAVTIAYNKFGVLERSCKFPTFTDVLCFIDKAAKNLNLSGNLYKNATDHVKFVLEPYKKAGLPLNPPNGFTVAEFFTREDVVLNLSKFEKDMVVRTVVSNLFKDILRFRSQQPETPTKLRTLIIVDEARRVFPANEKNNSLGHDPTRSMEMFGTIRRSYGIGLFILTQEPSSLPEWLISNLANVMCFPITGKARKEAAVILNLNPAQEEYFDELAEYGQAIMNCRRFNRRFKVEIPEVITEEPITDAEVDEIMEPWLKEAYARFGTEPEHETPSTYDFASSKEKLLKYQREVHGEIILNIVAENPFEFYSTIQASCNKSDLGMSQAKFKEVIEWLQDADLIKKVELFTPHSSKTKANYLQLTDKGYNSIHFPQGKRISHLAHRIYLDRVHDFLIQQGHSSVSKEYSLSPNLDEGGLSGRIDVFAIESGLRVAYEVQLTIDKRAVISHVHKAFSTFGCDYLWFVSETKDDIAKIKAMVDSDESIHPEDFYRIGFKKITEFTLNKPSLPGKKKASKADQDQKKQGKLNLP